MDELLQEIKILPAVIGSMVHINGVNQIISDLPKVFRGKAEQIGQSVERICKVNESCHIDLNSIEMKFDESLVMIKPIDKGSAIVTICDPGVNLPLVNMTTSMLVSEFRSSVNAIRKDPSALAGGSKDAAATKAPKPAAKKIDINAILHTGPMAKILHEVQGALALAIGPIGEVVMKESVEKWANSGDSNPARLGELVTILCEEIDDASLEEEFRNSIAKHLGN